MASFIFTQRSRATQKSVRVQVSAPSTQSTGESDPSNTWIASLNYYFFGRFCQNISSIGLPNVPDQAGGLQGGHQIVKIFG